MSEEIVEIVPEINLCVMKIIHVLGKELERPLDIIDDKETGILCWNGLQKQLNKHLETKTIGDVVELYYLIKKG